MSERCSHCHKATRDACSRYSGRARVLALQSCSNMSEVDRYREAASCAGAESSDRELAICMAFNALWGEELSLIRVKSQQRFQRPASNAPFYGADPSEP